MSRPEGGFLPWEFDAQRIVVSDRSAEPRSATGNSASPTVENEPRTL